MIGRLDLCVSYPTIRTPLEWCHACIYVNGAIPALFNVVYLLGVFFDALDLELVFLLSCNSLLLVVATFCSQDGGRLLD